MFRQGDVFIARIEKLPEGVAEQAPLPHATLVHGEATGHSHRIEDPTTARLFAGVAPGEVFIEVVADAARVVHEEHGPIVLERGFYRAWRQREYSPEAIRHVYD